jgi:hypothetical protein
MALIDMSNHFLSAAREKILGEMDMEEKEEETVGLLPV